MSSFSLLFKERNVVTSNKCSNVHLITAPAERQSVALGVNPWENVII